MTRVTFAATSGLLLARARAGSAWHGARRGARRCALALGLVLALAAASAADDHNRLQRDIRETQEIAAEVSRAVRRVQAENLKLRKTLGTEARNLTADDITVTTLRLARLDADTARLHVTTLENRIAQREGTLRLLEEDINRRVEDLESAPETALETLAVRAQLQQSRELHAVSIDLLAGFRKLHEAEAERLALAEERLALLRSRAELRRIPETGRFDQDPRIVAIRTIISRLARDAVRLDNEAGAARPKAAPDPARQGLLQLEAGDAIIRSSVRVADLQLIRAGNQLDFYEDLIGDESIPLGILREARVELGEQRMQLERRLAALNGDRLTLEGQRELILAQATAPAEAGAAHLGPVQDLAGLLDFQQADIMRLQQRSADMGMRLDAEIARREFMSLRGRQVLPANVGHWELILSELIQLPRTALGYWRGVLADLVDRTIARPLRDLVGLRAAMLVTCAATWWLYRIGLPRLALLNLTVKSGVALEALRRTLPSSLPVAFWFVVAWRVGLDPRPMRLFGLALGLWPLAGFVLRASRLFAGETGDRMPQRIRPRAWMRAALVSAAALGARVLLVRAVPTLPSVADLIERAGFVCIAIVAVGGWILRADLLDHLLERAAMPIAGQRLVAVATAAVPTLLLLSAAVGLGGWINLGWTIAHGVAAFLAAAGLALMLGAVLRDLANALQRRYGGTAGTGAPDATETIEAGYRLAVVAVIVGAVGLFAHLYLHSTTARAAFWIIAVTAALPFILQPVQILVAFFLDIDPERRPDGSISIPAICIDRGMRALLVIGTVLPLVWALDFNLVALATSDTLLTRIVRGLFNIAAIVLVADFVWHLAKTAIDGRLQTTAEVDAAESDEARRQARLRTLLPILRNVLLAVIAVTAVLMALSSIGIQIGPLLAGAGVVGIAIGFGAQTLVRDIFAGVFYLLDDAFRVGEYIQSGEYKGTVEAFSLRSVKIRHHRGSLFTVPFGELGAVQNMSRDWVIDKLNISVTYDTDLGKVKKVIKEVSKQIMAEPELAANVIEPLKMQGVEQFGDFAIEIRMKMMTKPGEQFLIRRRAYALIKQAFDANNIEFAFPTVTVAGGGEANAAAAQQALKLVQPDSATAQPAG
jgi:small-conductance mechanosensitive channel